MQASAADTGTPATTGTHPLAGRLLLVWKQLTALAGTQVTGVLEELDLSLSQLKTLEYLAAPRTEEPSVKALSEVMGCSVANSSRSVDTLVRRGLLERREDEHDRRIRRLALTDAGRTALARVDAVRLDALERFAASLEPEQRDRLHAALDGVVPHPR